MENIPPFLLLGGITILGFYAGKIIRLANLPSIIGFMLVGLLLGPSFGELSKLPFLSLLRYDDLESLSFLNEIALGLVAFTIGSELRLKTLRAMGRGIVAIILAESFGAFLVVLGAIATLTWLTDGQPDWPMALIFASVAPASAPAGTVAVIQEYKAKGSLTTALYAVVGFDDGLAIFIFGFAAALAKTLIVADMPGSVEPSFLATMWVPVKEILSSLVIGAVLGYLFCFLVRRVKHNSEYFILVMGFVFIALGLSTIFHMSLILTNLVIGFVLVNTRTEALVRKVGEQMSSIMPMTFILFFSLAGAHLNLKALPQLGLVGVIYILARSGGLIGGSRVGAMVGQVEDKIKKYVGLGILSQAGVAIGLSLIVASEFRDLGAEGARISASIITTITATCIFFEIIGPILTKIALTKAGEIPEDRL
ncbi:MAG: cation:proton antiporter [Planctomycetes bacterium]|nr:cation:proton antiporter [Planctomycetota bacterium]